MSAKFQTVTIGARKVEVSVTPDGCFESHVDGEYFRAEKFRDLTDKLRKALRNRGARVKVKGLVPSVGYGEWQEVVGTAIHGRNRNLLCTINDAKDERWSLMAFKPDTPKDVLARYLEVMQQAKKLEDEGKALEKKWQFDVKDAVTKAIDEKLKAEDEKQAPSAEGIADLVKAGVVKRVGPTGTAVGQS